MNDLISRQAAIDALGNEPEVWSRKDEYAQGLNNQWHYDVNALKAVPSAERPGRWKTVDKGHYFYDWECSVCGGSGRWDYHFCPNCGSRMDLEADEDD